MPDHPEEVGQWSDVIKTPGDARAINDNEGVYAVHGILLHTGEVLLFSGRLESAQSLYEGWVWEPGDPGPPGSITTEEEAEAFTADAERAPFNNENPEEPEGWLDDEGHATASFEPGLDLFCSHHIHLEDGKVLVVGGAGANKPGDAAGLPAVYVFDPEATPPGADDEYRNYWTKLQDMALGRWYPTSVMLPDGRVLVFSGRPNSEKDVDRDGNPEHGINPRVELFAPPEYDPRDLGEALDREFYIYPGMHLVRGGEIFYTGTSWHQHGPAFPTVSFEMTGPYDAQWNQYNQPGVGDAPLLPSFPERQEGMSVLMPPGQSGQILLIGGSRRAPDVQATDDDGNLLWRIEGDEELIVAADPNTGTVIGITDRNGNPVTDDEGNPIPVGGTITPGEHDDGDVEGGTGALDGVTHVEAVLEWGGLTPASNPAAVEVLHTQGEPDNPASTDPTWETVGDMNIGPDPDPESDRPEGVRGRANVNVVLLPDGKVFIAGGKYDHKNAPYGFVRNAEIFDPETGDFKTVAAQGANRGYHSVTLLLPDGRVMAAGDGRTMEFYNPPYLFTEPDVPRLEIRGIDVPNGPEGHAHYGGRFEVRVDDASRVRETVLMRPGAVTHHTDSDQRYVPASFTRRFSDEGDDVLEVTVPHDSSVIPPGHYMVFLIDEHDRPCERAEFVRISHRKCEIINNRSTFSRDEIQTYIDSDEEPIIQETFYVHVDGFLPGELEIGDTLPTGSAIDSLPPNMSLTDSVLGMTIEPERIIPESTDLDPGLRQRFTFVYNVRFENLEDFPDASAGDDLREIGVEFEVNGHRCTQTLRLIDQPNPYMLDGPTHWLSVDLRVFRVLDDEKKFGERVEGDPHAFIQQVIDNLESPSHEGGFETLPTTQEDGRLNLASHEDGKPVWNFALAQVRYRGSPGVDASGVRCFFRMFQTAVTNFEFDPDTTYHRTEGENPVPLLGQVGGEVVTIPFFAHPRADDMSEQTVEERNLEGEGEESIRYFGCWLDINQSDALRFPERIDPDNTGPYTATTDNPLRSIQQLVARGEHQCLVAEVDFQDLLKPGDTPSSSDKLSQRNLAYLPSDNPGSETSRVVQHTFDLKPKVPGRFVRALLGKEEATEVLTTNRLAAFVQRPSRFTHDELQIFWNGIPSGTEVELFMPNADLDSVLELHRRRYGPEFIEKVDASTLRVQADGATHLPIVGNTPGNIAGLMTLHLPETIVAGDEFHVVAHQIDGIQRRVVGSFEFDIPVQKAEEIVGWLSNSYAVLKWAGESIAPSSRWYPVFQAYLEEFAARVRGLGVDPDAIDASPAGTGRTRDDEQPTEPEKPVDTGPLVPPRGARSYTGKVSTVVYDCFGDFEGFILESCPGRRSFRSTEESMEDVIQKACAERNTVTVYWDEDSERIQRVVVHC